jgi:beta-lactamase regulating signal transducer with metallopeptidase domain
MTAEWIMLAAVAAAVNSVAPGLCLAAATWILVRLLPRANASTRYTAWWLCLVALVALPVAQLAQVESGARQGAIHKGALESHAASPPGATPPAAPGPLPGPVPPMGAPQADVDFAAVASVFWILGGLFSLTKLARSYRWIRKRRAASSPGDQSLLAACLARCPTRRCVELRVSDEIRTPMATGFLRPAILLPARLAAHLDDDEMNDIVTHELAHLARRDDWVQLAERLLGALLWFHPAVRWALRAIRREREHCCDDRVVNGNTRARAYAASLVKLAEWRRGEHSLALAAAGGSGPSDTYRRVEALLRRKDGATIGVSKVRLGAAALALAVVSAATARVTIMMTVPPLVAAQAPASPKAPLTAPPASKAPPTAPTAPKAPPPVHAPKAAPPVTAGASAAPVAAVAPQPRPAGLLAALKAAGYGDLSVEEIIEIKNAGVSADYLLDLRDAGVARMTPRELMSLKQYGVSAAYVKELLAAGGFAIRDVVEMRAHGVPATLPAAVQRLRFGPYTTRQIIEMSNNGVRAEFFQMLHDNGVKQIDAREVVEARVHGLSDASLREARRYGPNLTFQQIIKLKRAGVI